MIHKTKKWLLAYLIILITIGLSMPSFAVSPDKLVEQVEGKLASNYYEEFDVSADSSGHVMIEGEVNSLFDKYRVFEIASKVPEVTSITNNLIVDTPLIADEVIETNIETEFQYVSSILDPQRIKVEVNNGVVILRGNVSFHREKMMARTVASWQEGVKGLINEIEVLPPKKAKSDENLKDVMQAIMDNQFSLEKNVSFKIENGIVTLSGSTQDLWSKQAIEEEFANVIGVKEVINNITVKPSFQ